MSRLRWLMMCLVLIFSGVSETAAVTSRDSADSRIKVVLAVLPFEVSSPERLGYLQEAAMDLLSSRLEKHDGI